MPRKVSLKEIVKAIDVALNEFEEGARLKGAEATDERDAASRSGGSSDRKRDASAWAPTPYVER